MPNTLHLKPAPGLNIPDPATGKHLPATGDAVDDCPYWRRRLREKSVELTDAKSIKKARDAAEKAEKAKADAEAKEKAAAEKAKADAEATGQKEGGE